MKTIILLFATTFIFFSCQNKQEVVKMYNVRFLDYNKDRDFTQMPKDTISTDTVK